MFMKHWPKGRGNERKEIGSRLTVVWDLWLSGLYIDINPRHTCTARVNYGSLVCLSVG